MMFRAPSGNVDVMINVSARAVWGPRAKGVGGRVSTMSEPTSEARRRFAPGCCAPEPGAERH